MKETNMEHFRDEIEDIIESSYEQPCLIDGKLQICNGGMDCCKCEFSGGRGNCGVSFVKWLMSEYKPEPVLTEREKHFVEFAQEGYLARDKDGKIYRHEEKPYKGNECWHNDSHKFIGVNKVKNIFPFITWEDEEPWSVEDLRKLKVKGGEADD